MRRVLIIITLVILSFVSGYYLIAPVLTKKTPIEISYENKDHRVSLKNETYLYQKMAEVGFWDNGTIFSLDTSQKVPVRLLRILMVDKEQKYGRTLAYFSKWIVMNSFDQSYDPEKQIMTIIIQAHNNSNSIDDLAKRFGGSVLIAVFDITHVGKYKNDKEREKLLFAFIKDYIENSASKSFISISKK